LESEVIKMVFGYDELKECVKEDFCRFRYEIKYSVEHSILATLNEYEHAEDFTETEGSIIYFSIALLLISEGIGIESIKEKLIELIESEKLNTYRKELKEEFSLLEEDLRKLRPLLGVAEN